jgi:hypothetical protein
MGVARTVRGWKFVPKLLLTRLGARCSDSVVYNLNGAFNYLHAGWWLRSHGFSPELRVKSRDELFDAVGRRLADRDVLYLEFGVHTGDSMHYWSRLLRSPRSRLHGFDSFKGLPHDWSLEGHERGYFSTGGEPPAIDDPRVEFFVGWFDETLPRYRWVEHDALVVVLDADLYASTSTVLRHVCDHLKPGSFLYFDQFHHRSDELRAFAELVDEHELNFRLVGTSHDLSNVLFERLP